MTLVCAFCGVWKACALVGVHDESVYVSGTELPKNQAYVAFCFDCRVIREKCRDAATIGVPMRLVPSDTMAEIRRQAASYETWEAEGGK
jgi:hypothetical protein